MAFVIFSTHGVDSILQGALSLLIQSQYYACIEKCKVQAQLSICWCKQDDIGMQGSMQRRGHLGVQVAIEPVHQFINYSIQSNLPANTFMMMVQ